MNVDMTLDEIMDRAADIIDARGWCRGEAINGRGEVCVLGALSFAGDSSVSVIAFIEESTDITSQRVGGWWITKWNDHVCADQYEAAEFLRTEAKRYREETSR